MERTLANALRIGGSAPQAALVGGRAAFASSPPASTSVGRAGSHSNTVTSRHGNHRSASTSAATSLSRGSRFALIGAERTPSANLCRGGFFTPNGGGQTVGAHGGEGSCLLGTASFWAGVASGWLISRGSVSASNRRENAWGENDGAVRSVQLCVDNAKYWIRSMATVLWPGTSHSNSLALGMLPLRGPRTVPLLDIVPKAVTQHARTQTHTQAQTDGDTEIERDMRSLLRVPDAPVLARAAQDGLAQGGFAVARQRMAESPVLARAGVEVARQRTALATPQPGSPLTSRRALTFGTQPRLEIKPENSILPSSASLQSNNAQRPAPLRTESIVPSQSAATEYSLLGPLSPGAATARVEDNKRSKTLGTANESLANTLLTNRTSWLDANGTQVQQQQQQSESHTKPVWSRLSSQIWKDSSASSSVEGLVRSLSVAGAERHAARIMEEHNKSAQRKRDSISRLQREQEKSSALGEHDAIPGFGSAMAQFMSTLTSKSPALDPSKTRSESAHARMLYNLGVSYKTGTGVTRDMTKAAECYKNAAALGHAKAMYNLGVLHITGEGGVAQDWSEAAHLFERAAHQGFAHAQRSVGLCYAYGKGLPRDEDRARFWLRQAAEKGDSHAQRELTLLARSGGPADLNDVKSA